MNWILKCIFYHMANIFICSFCYCEVKGKGKVVFVHAVKACWGSGGKLYLFSTSALNGSEWLASCPSHLTPRKGIPVTTE
jgi:hypothetical protein